MISRAFYALIKYFCWGWLLLYHRLTIKGRGNIPSERPFIVAANHCSNLDPVIVGVACPEKLRYMAKAELFDVPILRHLIKALGAVPVPRENRQGAAAVLKLFLSRLEREENVLLFPEGRRSPDGKLQPMEGGVALLAMKTGAPIVPVYVKGSFEALKSKAVFPRPTRISVHFGKPLHSGHFKQNLSEREARKALMGALEEQMQIMEADSRLA